MRTNQLILRASPEQAAEVSKLLAELDVDVPGK
jgi:type II secretory pathway component GspD/PulD (secretin)